LSSNTNLFWLTFFFLLPFFRTTKQKPCGHGAPLSKRSTITTPTAYHRTMSPKPRRRRRCRNPSESWRCSARSVSLCSRRSRRAEKRRCRTKKESILLLLLVVAEKGRVRYSTMKHVQLPPPQPPLLAGSERGPYPPWIIWTYRDLHRSPHGRSRARNRSCRGARAVRRFDRFHIRSHLHQPSQARRQQSLLRRRLRPGRPALKSARPCAPRCAPRIRKSPPRTRRLPEGKRHGPPHPRPQGWPGEASPRALHRRRCNMMQRRR